MRHLFEKNLSDHSIGAYKELFEEVGNTFEAVRSGSQEPVAYPGEVLLVRNIYPSLYLSNLQQDSNRSGPVSFTSKINELQIQNDYLSQQLQFVKFQLEAEVKLRLGLEEKLKLSHDRQEVFREDLQRANSREGYFRAATMKYSEGLSKLLPIISELHTNPPVTSDGFL